MDRFRLWTKYSDEDTWRVEFGPNSESTEQSSEQIQQWFRVFLLGAPIVAMELRIERLHVAGANDAESPTANIPDHIS